jgi:hypothetical protein
MVAWMQYQNLGQLVVGDIVELCAVKLGDDELDEEGNVS